jgi:uncharacterized protein
MVRSFPNQILLKPLFNTFFMFSALEGTNAVMFARDVVESYVKDAPLPKIDKTSRFHQKLGVFVTLHTYPDHMLRGCIGIPEPIMPLNQAIIEAGTSVTHDPRFPPLQENELDSVIVEITLLTKPMPIVSDDPKNLLKKIIIGKDGLIIRYRGQSGLLLPQVPFEQGWDTEDFLMHLCLKAGLAPDAWFEKDAVISSFQGQIFTEIKPKGPIEEKITDDL